MLVLSKSLTCGHTRRCAQQLRPGQSAHCDYCHGLADVESVAVAPGSTLSNYYRRQLDAAGFTALEIRKLEQGGIIGRPARRR